MAAFIPICVYIYQNSINDTIYISIVKDLQKKNDREFDLDRDTAR